MASVQHIEAGVINPAMFSEGEIEFFLSHLGEPTSVALRSAGADVNVNAVTPLLNRVNELQSLAEHRGEQWLGVEALKEGFALYLDQYRTWRRDRRRGAPRFPSLYTYTAKGRPVPGGPGADAGIVQSYFTEAGERKSFLMNLLPHTIDEWKPNWGKADEPAPNSLLIVNHDLNRWECFCGVTESFKPESRASYAAAKARISKHLRSAKEEVEKHREAYSLEFGS